MDSPFLVILILIAGLALLFTMATTSQAPQRIEHFVPNVQPRRLNLLPFIVAALVMLLALLLGGR